MHVTPHSTQKVRWRKVLLFCAIVGLVGWIVLRAIFTEKNIATVRFADGAKAEILAVIVGNKLTVGQMKLQTSALDSVSQTIRRFFRQPVAWPQTESGASGFTTGIDLAYFAIKGETHARGIQIKTKDPRLIMLIRGFEPDGRATRWESALHGTWFPGKNHTEPISLTDLPMNLEIWTGEQAGWFPVNGPHHPHSLDGRAYCYATGFQRSSPTLRLRFTRHGQPPVEIAIANPDPSQRESWTTEPLPSTKRAGANDVTLTGVEWDKLPIGVVTAELQLKIKPNPEQCTPHLDGVRDASGNPALLPSMSDGNQRFLLPPGLGPWRARFTIQRDKNYEWPLSEMNVLLEGEFTAPGEPLKLTPTDFFTSLGTLTLTGDSKHADSAPDGTVELHINWHLQSLTDLPEVAEDLRKVRWYFFAEGKTVANFSGYATGNHGPKAMKMQTMCKGPLRAGTRFQLGILKQTPPQTVEFTFDPPPYPARWPASRRVR